MVWGLQKHPIFSRTRPCSLNFHAYESIVWWVLSTHLLLHFRRLSRPEVKSGNDFVVVSWSGDGWMWGGCRSIYISMLLCFVLFCDSVWLCSQAGLIQSRSFLPLPAVATGHPPNLQAPALRCTNSPHIDTYTIPKEKKLCHSIFLCPPPCLPSSNSISLKIYFFIN